MEFFGRVAGAVVGVILACGALYADDDCKVKTEVLRIKPGDKVSHGSTFARHSLPDGYFCLVKTEITQKRGNKVYSGGWYGFDIDTDCPDNGAEGDFVLPFPAEPGDVICYKSTILCYDPEGVLVCHDESEECFTVTRPNIGSGVVGR